MDVRRTILLASAALPVWLAGSAAAWAQEAQQPSEDEEIVVTGIRESLATSIEQKRRADQIVDTITAEDIGKLPDQNIAESIQRITGVQITRSGGEGLGVNIRGLTALTTINGRVGLGPAGRNFYLSARHYDYRNLAAEFFQTIEVFKSPLASQPEGALGGTVNLITRKPLDFDSPVISIGVEGQYSDYVEQADPRGSLFIAASNDRVGASLSATYGKRSVRGDYFQALGGWQRSTLGVPTGFDFNPNDAAVNQDVIRPIDLRYRTQDADRTRYGLEGTLQFRPTDSLELRFDGTFSRFENVFRNSWFRTFFNNPTSFVPGSLQIDEDGSLVGGRFVNQAVQVDGRYEPEIVDSYVLGGNVKWEKDRLSVIVDANISQTDYTLISQFLRYQGAAPATVDFAFRGPETPPTIALTNAAGAPYDLTDPALYLPNLSQDRVIAATGKERVVRGDLKYDVEAGPLAALSAGVRATWRDSTFRVLTSANQVGNTRNPAFFDPVTGRRLTAADQPLSTFNGPFPWREGIFPGVDGAIPREWLNGVYQAVGASGSPQYLDLLNIRDFGGLLNSNPEQSDIAEDTIAGYVMADFGGDIAGLEFKANAGVRYIRNDTRSEGVFVNAAGVLTPIVVENSDDNWLPAANVTLNLTENLLLRLAGARVLQRPDLDQLATGYNLNLSSGVATVGNPLLEPFKADQFDVSLEYYPVRGALISAALFYKDVKNFVGTRTFTGEIPGAIRLDGGTTFLITQPVNAGGGTIKGFELGVQMPFFFLSAPFDGLGAIANYTFSDADTDSGQPIPRLSRQSVNLIAYYEQAGFQARVAYSYRTAYAETGEGGNASQPLGLYEYIAPAGYLDASISYDITPTITLSIDGANLLRTEEIRYSGIETRLRDLQVTDRRFTFGVRARFQ